MELFLYGDVSNTKALSQITGKQHRWKKAFLPGYALDGSNATRSASGTIPGILVTDIASEDIVQLDLFFQKKIRVVERVRCGSRLAQAFVYVDENQTGRRNAALRRLNRFLRMDA